MVRDGIIGRLKVYVDKALTHCYRDLMRSLVSPTVRVLRELLRDPESEHWGHQLSKDAEVSQGTIYGILRRLAEQGWLTERVEIPEPDVKSSPRPGGSAGPARRLYRLTDAGRDHAARAVHDAVREVELALAADDARGLRFRMQPRTAAGSAGPS